MTGKELFMMYVANALCSGVYKWEMLSKETQHRWNKMAHELAWKLHDQKQGN